MISIIIPVYNCRQWLPACIDSILTQSYADIELLLIDDGSTDGSSDICDDYASRDPRIRVMHTSNRGQSSARNLGLDNMQGDMVSFVDSDDILLPDALQTLLSLMQTTGADIAEGERIAGRNYQGSPRLDSGSYATRLFSPTEAMESCLYQATLHNSPWGKLYRRHIFDKLRFAEGMIYEDLDLIYRLHDISRLSAYTSRPVYFYRKGHASTTGTFTERRLDVLKVVSRIETYMAANHPELLLAAHDRALSAYFNIFWLSLRHNANMTAVRDECWRQIKVRRRESLTNPKVRLKNKAAVILSYLGRNFFSFICRIVK